MAESNNPDSINAFESSLFAYEKLIPEESHCFKDYQEAAFHINSAMDHLINASTSDVYSMMRRLIAHITSKIDTAYSDFILNMVTTVSSLEYKQKVMTIFHVIRESVLRNDTNLSENLPQMIGQNHAICHFLNNYKHHSNRIIEKSYSSVLLTPRREEIKVNSIDDHYFLTVANYNYQVYLTNNKAQQFSLLRDVSYQAKVDQSTSESFPSVTQIVITPTFKQLILDKSLQFCDNAIAQLSTLNCVQQGYVSGVDTIINLPGMFYSILINVVSYDDETFQVIEFNILPPSLSRHL